MDTSTCTVKILREFPALQHVPDAQLQWLLSKGKCWALADGEYLFRPDSPVNNMQLLLSGSMHIYTLQNGSKLSLLDQEAPFLTGKLPYSRLEKATGYAQATRQCEVLSVNESHFPEMIREHYELTAALVHFMTSRVRAFTAQSAQNEKLMSLGKLSAGLSHELNNPASAVVRSAQALGAHLKALPEGFKAVMRIRMEDADVDKVNAILFEKLKQADEAEALSLMQRNDREDEIAGFLEEKDLEDAYEIAENLVHFNWTLEDVEKVSELTPAEHFAPVMGWLNQNMVTESMVMEIEEASSRIKELVTSVKGYTHMDQGLDKRAVDIHLSLKRTLTMLGHKVKKLGVEVDKELEENLPHIEAFAGEVNQVFTNLLDNALDAMEESDKKVLRIATQQLDDFVKIEIADSGSGIPKDIQTRIFDPFFTTKDMDKGTGMGLDIVQKIITHHHGRISVDSDQSGSTFTILLPINYS